MQPEKFKYSLQIDGVWYVLENAPDGWEDTVLNYKRSPNYWGLIRSFTVPLTFVLDGAWLLRREFYRNRAGAKATLKIEALRNRDWTYRLVEFGEVDFSEFKDGGDSVSVTVVRAGLSEAVTSSDKNVYEFSLNDPKAVLVEIPSVSLIDFAQLLVLPQTYSVPNTYRIFPLDVVQNDLINQKVQTQIIEASTVVSSLGTSDSWFVKANEATSVTISGILEAFCGITQLSDRVFVELRNGANQLKGSLVTYLAGQQVNQFRTNFSISFDMVAGEEVFLVTRYTGNISQSQRGDLTVEFFEVKITNEIQSPPSQAKAFPAFALYEKLLEKMAGEPVNCDSVLLKGSNLFFACGDSIREFESPVLKTSFADFYNSVDALLGCGFGIDGEVARLEVKEFFFREIEALHLGEAKSFELSVSQQFLFNGLRVGYKEQNYEKDQGREEFNQGQSWTSPNKRTDQVLDRICPYRADHFGVSVLRRLTISDNALGVDTESDNDVWVLQGSGVEVAGVYKLERGADFTYVAGISNRDNMININLSPKRCLLRSGSFIGIGLDGFENKLLELASAEKNAGLVAEKAGSIVYENQPLAISALGRKLFLPYLVKITVAMPKDGWSLIDQNLFGFFSFSYNSQTFRGYIEEASNDIGTNTERDISLYLHPATNLQNLIK